MKNRLFIGLTAMLIIVSTRVDAQVLDRVGERVKQRTQQRTDAKVDQTVDKALDKIFGIGNKKQTKENDDETINDQESNDQAPSESQGYGGLNIGGMLSKHLGDGCEAKDQYSFDGDVTMKYTSREGKKKGEEVEMNMRMHFSNDMSAMAIVYLENSMGLEPENSTIVVDMMDSFTVMKMNVSGQAINMCTDMKKSMGGETGGYTDEDLESWTKTGRTKIILGYTCEEYVQEQEGNKMEVWVTDKISNFMMNPTGAQGSPMATLQLPDNVPMGYPLESIITSNDGSVATITTTEINENKKTTIRMK